MKKAQIGILGAGLVGTLLSCLLARRGFSVQVFEKRPDPRSGATSEGRSINLALSHRGIRTLKVAGIFDQVEKLLIPMFGRTIHTDEGLDFHSYGKSDQHINAVSRHKLNTVLIEHAQASGVELHFDTLVENADPDHSSLTLDTGVNYQFDGLIGADGAFSMLRKIMAKRNTIHTSEGELLAHRYKELTIPAKSDEYAIDPNSLHIWPRKNYMLIALPNLDKTFTCTLFLPAHGDSSFDQLVSKEAVTHFFKESFPDILPLMPNYSEQFQTNPNSSLHTIKAYPWVYHRSLLIGDAAHAIVPFYGQGMNAGFEDCRIFMEILEINQFDWEKSISQFQESRKADTDAIAHLALQNFLEMRDHVINEEFLKRKELEIRMQEAFPEHWLPLYSMVTFSDIPYRIALKTGEIQLKAIQTLGKNYDPKSVDLRKLLQTFKKLMKDDH